MQYDEKKNSLTKLWYYIKRKTIKSRNIKKISSNYCDDDNLDQLSDNESDKTVTEIENKKKLFERGRKATSVKSNKSYDSNDNKLYDKRDNSLDIVRNKNDDYEVVMHYQRYSNSRTKKNNTCCKCNKII
jgi:hydroxymethylglutaryl-CoA reductase